MFPKPKATKTLVRRKVSGEDQSIILEYILFKDRFVGKDKVLENE